MPRKSKEDRAEYMRDYRRKINEAVSLEGKDLDRKLEEYREKGLDKNDLFMDTVYRLAMKGNNAKYAELWWRMTKPEPEERKKSELTASDYIKAGKEVLRSLEEEWEKSRGVHAICPTCGSGSSKYPNLQS